MEVTDIDQTAVTPASPASAGAFEQCDSCGAPVESIQRYCVACGARRRHVADPAARFLAGASARPRRPVPSPASGNARRSPGLGLALILAVIPLAVGLGVLVGRDSTGGDGKLIAALRAQKPQVLASGGSATQAAAGPPSTAAASLSSTFPFQTGYAVELQTLSVHGASAASVSRAESDARNKGAKAVGLILPSDFHITPAPPAGSDVIYSGAFRTRAQADAALAKLKRQFKAAKVIAVRSVAAAAGAGQVLAKTRYGTAHQITGFKATPAALAQGKQVVNRIAKQVGGNYVGSQRNLPDQISVP